MNPLAAIGRAFDVVDQLVTDEDKSLEIKAGLHAGREATYQLELSTKTVPWVDGLHKMGRQIISLVTVVGGMIFLAYNPDVDPIKLAALSAPGGIYNYIKGKGK